MVVYKNVRSNIFTEIIVCEIAEERDRILKMAELHPASPSRFFSPPAEKLVISGCFLNLDVIGKRWFDRRSLSFGTRTNKIAVFCYKEYLDSLDKAHSTKRN